MIRLTLQNIDLRKDWLNNKIKKNIDLRKDWLNDKIDLIKYWFKKRLI